MKKIFIPCFAAVFFMMAQTSSVEGAVLYDSGTTWYTGSISVYQHFSADMVGMEVTATVKNGAGTNQETVIWGLNGVTGTGWALSFTSPATDTFNTTWDLDVFDTGTSLLDVTIDGTKGNTVFDVLKFAAIDPNTPGSENGWPIGTSYDTVSAGLTFDATYSNLVALEGSSGPVGDLYTTLKLDFTAGGGYTPFESDSVLKFYSDTDEAVPAPEPASMMLFGFGLLAVPAVRKFAAR